MIRKPIVSGQFYSSDKEELLNSIKECFTSSFGPGSLPGSAGSLRIYGGIVPHAGYPYSGMCAAWFYKALAESKKPDLVLILGTNHRYKGKPCTMKGGWETPLGVAECDDEFVDLLVKHGAIESSENHQNEHSIEVQIPFLQFIYPDFKFVPLLIGDSEFENNSALIQKAISESGKEVIVIASSDFTHYGVNYGYVPFTSDVKKNVYELDKGAIDFILKNDAIGFNFYVSEKEATICGRNNIPVLVSLLKDKNSSLLKYYTSGDVSGDYSCCVGYGCLLFK
ncbi:AmmeMemoRadiSam system protein B [Candidatus Woesearchaeota archaeon]|jgi:MEMO1 family protein|nr:AmmeMemoRadiSam system protein B [Candidatus Woesearchaeota archaeon]MBT4698148.1 AmmeMemoRadiSam system protein B [Candidatus Woesearchaeota archaeon]MBT4716371.1 AmmeMemoRadiSam system protein B [Candidatus Woesearchaeota archaeon]MBT7930287.1 AmmeMemoRadiSam system protein B [Candidatus Woesearchaeota archaeon]